MKQDWADEIADQLFMGISCHELDVDGGPFVDRIAAALRKAKADGMRDAARWAEVHVKYREILARADAVEKGET